MNGRIIELKNKIGQIVHIKELGDDEQLIFHFKILLLNYLMSNDFDESLIMKIGKKLNIQKYVPDDQNLKYFFKLLDELEGDNSDHLQQFCNNHSSELLKNKSDLELLATIKSFRKNKQLQILHKKSHKFEKKHFPILQNHIIDFINEKQTDNQIFNKQIKKELIQVMPKVLKTDIISLFEKILKVLMI